MNTPEITELAVSMDGPTAYANRFVANGTQAGVRIAFMEALQGLDSLKFRAAVLMSYQDAIDLKNLLAELVEPIETQIFENKKKVS